MLGPALGVCPLTVVHDTLMNRIAAQSIKIDGDGIFHLDLGQLKICKTDLRVDKNQ